MEKSRTVAATASAAGTGNALVAGSLSDKKSIRTRILSGESFSLRNESYTRTYRVLHLEHDLYTLQIENLLAAIVNRNNFLSEGFAVSVCLFNIRHTYSVFYENVQFANRVKGGSDE